MRRRAMIPILGLTCPAVGLLSAAALFGLVAHAGPSPAQTVPQQIRLELPPGWTVFRGQSGLVVPHPAGWSVQERGEGGFVAYCPGPDGGAVAVAYVQPIAKIEGRAAGIVQGLAQIVPEIFPGVQVGRTRVVSSQPDVAVGELSYTPKATKFIGAVLCFKDNSQGVVYAIASRADAWLQAEGVLKQVLGRFFYSGRTAQAGHASGPPMVTWRDPVEGAFTCVVPQGWKVEGGLKRYSLPDVRPEVVVTSPDNKVLVRFGDAFIPLMALPTQIGMQYGQVEGTWQNGVLGAKMLIMRYLPSTMFLTQIYLPQRVGPVSNVQARDLPQISQQRMIQKAGAGQNVRVDTGEITFDAQTESGLRKGYGFIQTELAPMGASGAGNWYVPAFAGYLAEPGAEPLARAVLNRLVAEYRKDPNWDARQTQSMLTAYGIARQAQLDTFNIINQAFAERSRSQDRSFANWDRAYNDQVLIQDPTTGEKFEVPSGSHYYFRVGSDNQFVGTDTAASPYSPNHWLTEMRIGN